MRKVSLLVASSKGSIRIPLDFDIPSEREGQPVYICNQPQNLICQLSRPRLQMHFVHVVILLVWCLLCSLCVHWFRFVRIVCIVCAQRILTN